MCEAAGADEFCRARKQRPTRIETTTFTGEPGPPIKHETTFVISPAYERLTAENSTVCENALVTPNVGNNLRAQEVYVKVNKE